jgi:predicted amidohydrolase YtcJ
MTTIHVPELTEKSITILHNGSILTMDKHSSIADAIGIFEDRVLAIGTRESVTSEANSFIRSSKEKLTLDLVNLAGSCIVPGFIDVGSMYILRRNLTFRK